jgi:trimeric autotransporter adhesin
MKRLIVFVMLLACAFCAMAQTQVTLTVSNPVALAGALVSFTATVSGTPTAASPTATIPTGTVTFEDGATAIGQTPLATTLGLATASYFTTSLAAGSHQITALYSGDANFKAATSAPTTLSIEPFSITPSVTSLTLKQGQTGTLTYTVADGTSKTSVGFACTPPANTLTTCSFNPDTVAGDGQTTLTITTTGAASALAGKSDLGLFACGSGALASFLLIWSPIGAAWRRRLGSRAELSALILALLLCGIMALQGCASSTPKPTAAATPPGTQAFEVITSASANSQSIAQQQTWITVNIQPAS